jgi:ADP-heptose:LPS heptosyltransferase
MKYFFYSIKYFNNYIIFLFLDFLIRRKRKNVHPETLLLIKLDSIGDYILFRNLIPYIKGSKFSNYKITYCGNIEIKELVLAYDSGFFNDFIWVDRLKFSSSIIYKFNILKDLYLRGFETAINTAYTREILYGDQIIKTCNAKERIGSIGSLDHRNNTKIFTDRFYTKLIPASETNLFEFYRNIEFFENLLEIEISLKRTSISSLKHYELMSSNFVLIFPGAKENKRKWKPKYYAIVSNYILSNYNYNIVISGSSKDYDIANQIIYEIQQKERVNNYAGKSSLTELVNLIANSKLLISNETAAVHLAAALDRNFICISNGNHFGRFNPYPKEICNNGHFIYPDEIDEELEEILRFNSELDINNIRPELINTLIKNILS